MREWLSVIMILAGSLLMFTASIGVVRLPDVFTRMHASTKAPALGLLFFVAAATLHFGSWQVAVKSIFIITFVFLTVPIASHMIGRAAHMTDTPQYHDSSDDDLREAREQL